MNDPVDAKVDLKKLVASHNSPKIPALNGGRVSGAPVVKEHKSPDVPVVKNKTTSVKKKSSIVQKRFVCPLCGNDMEIKGAHDSIRTLKCVGCYSSIVFGSAEAQRAIIDGEDVDFVFG